MPTREDRLFGPPGTGKTTTLSKWIARAAQQRGSDRIAVGSFTRAAAAEIASRDLPLQDSQVGTLHALAYRALGIERGQIADSPEALAEWNQEHPDWTLSGAERSGKEEDDFGSVKGQEPGDEPYLKLQSLRARMVDRESGAYHPVLGFETRWEEWKKETGRVDFTDLIDLATTDTDLPFQGAEVGFFDEAQDFTKLELTLVRHWAESMENVVLAGDDDQTIYWFKGAVPDAFLDPPIPAEWEHVLPQSYRVPREIQAIAQTWIERVARRKVKEYRPRDEEGWVRKLERGTWKSPHEIVDVAGQLADEGKSVMILATAGYMLGPVMKEARHAGLAYHNPYRRLDWWLNPLSSLRGISASQRILAYFRPEREAWGEDARLWTARDLHWIAEVLESKGVLHRGAKAALKAAAGTQRGVEAELDWLEILEWFTEDAAEHGLARPSLEWLEAHLLKSKASGFSFPLQIAFQRGLPALREEPKVTLGTIHSVKGGEADVVILIPDLSPAGAGSFYGGGQGRDAVIRTFYVGMTRAREGLVLARDDGVSAPIRALAT